MEIVKENNENINKNDVSVTKTESSEAPAKKLPEGVSRVDALILEQMTYKDGSISFRIVYNTNDKTNPALGTPAVLYLLELARDQVKSDSVRMPDANQINTPDLSK